MTSARNSILDNIRTTSEKKNTSSDRLATVKERLVKKPMGVIPARGKLNAEDRVALFTKMAEKAQASVVRVSRYSDIPQEVGNYLREHNLPASIITGDDKRLAKAKWSSAPQIEVKRGASDGHDLVGISHANAGIAETGTLVLASGAANPTTINFLPDHHIVVVSVKDIKGDIETSWGKLEKNDDGTVKMPRAINFVTGPSRSGDIEQKLLLGAHGPRALKIIIVG